jgi:hypothetical protein
MGLFSAVLTNVVVTGLFLGVGRRAGFLSFHPNAIREPNVRKAAELYLDSAQWAVTKAEAIIKAGTKALK